jgi:hypothetical protein
MGDGVVHFIAGNRKKGNNHQCLKRGSNQRFQGLNNQSYAGGYQDTNFLLRSCRFVTWISLDVPFIIIFRPTGISSTLYGMAETQPIFTFISDRHTTFTVILTRCWNVFWTHPVTRNRCTIQWIMNDRPPIYKNAKRAYKMLSVNFEARFQAVLENLSVSCCPSSHSGRRYSGKTRYLYSGDTWLHLSGVGPDAVFTEISSGFTAFPGQCMGSNIRHPVHADRGLAMLASLIPWNCNRYLKQSLLQNQFWNGTDWTV